MSPMSSDPRLLRFREAFLAQAIDRLGMYPSDFQWEIEKILASKETLTRHLAAGVLLPLLYRTPSSRGNSDEGEFVFQLIKRSMHVSQPGDLGCPGGMIHPVMDRLLRPLLLLNPLPIMSGRALAWAMERGPDSLRIITLFLATALRESWEEIRLSPFQVRFLGPLPTHTLTRFPRTIFPLVGFVARPGDLRPNREVEKLVEIPVASFFKAELIGYFTEPQFDPEETGILQSPQHPCLIHRNPSGGEEILWGATFHIIVRFLEIVMDYQVPDWTKGPALARTPRTDYLAGSSSS